MQEFQSIDVRPYKLMLVVSRIGAGCTNDLGDAELTEILSRSRNNPSMPITLRCPVTTNYRYQNPPDEGTAGFASAFYVRCDLKILQKMGMVPGATRPAIEIFQRLLKGVETARGILYFDEVVSETWKGLERNQCYYDQGRAMGLQALFPARAAEEMLEYKRDSVKQMYEAACLKIRPHHLLCMACFYGQRAFASIAEDNLFEAIQIIHGKPDMPIELVCGPCMICPPCHNYRPSCGFCVSPYGMALRDELKDLEVLQLLGLDYGDVRSATELYTRLFEKVHATIQVCGYGDGIERCPEFSVCQSAGDNTGYAKARTEGLGFLKVR